MCLELRGSLQGSCCSSAAVVLTVCAMCSGAPLWRALRCSRAPLHAAWAPCQCPCTAHGPTAEAANPPVCCPRLPGTGASSRWARRARCWSAPPRCARWAWTPRCASPTPPTGCWPTRVSPQRFMSRRAAAARLMTTSEAAVVAETNDTWAQHTTRENSTAVYVCR